MEFTTAEELLALCGSENITIADVMRRRESTEGELDPQTVEEKMKKAITESIVNYEINYNGELV